MFLNYYGLRENPFGVVADTRFLYLSPTHSKALDALCHGLGNGQDLLAFVAEPGLGKTLVLRRLATQLSVRIVSLSLTNSGARELPGLLLASLGVDSTNRDLPWMIERLNDRLRIEARSSHRFVLILDDAHNLTDSSLETLRLLSAFESRDHKLIQTVLAGQPRLAEALSRPEHAQLRQRLSVVARLEALPSTEVSKYIEHRLRIAGYEGSRLFTSPACEIAARWSGGIPRKINSLCFNALTAGCAGNKRQIDTAVVRRAIGALDLAALMSPARGASASYSAAGFGRARWIALALSLLLMLALVGLFSYRSAFNRRVSAAVVNTARRDQSGGSPAPSLAPELANSPRKGRDFVELPRVATAPSVPSTVSPVLPAPEEPAPQAAPTPTPDKLGLAQDETPPQDEDSEEAPTSDDASAASLEANPAALQDRANHDKVLSQIAQGEVYMREGQYDRAAREFQAALALDPASHDLRNKVEAARRAKAHVLQ